MSRTEARAALVAACAKVQADPETWRAEWAHMVKVQRAYAGALSLEPLLTLRPSGA